MSLKTFVNNKKEWDAFNEELDVRITYAHRNLEQANTLIKITTPIFFIQLKIMIQLPTLQTCLQYSQCFLAWK